jgi:hypothetical protein
MIASRAHDAQNEVKDRHVRGGPDAFRAKLGPSAKQTFVQYCADVWFLSGRGFDRGPRSNYLRFVHLLYEALTGVRDEKGSGLRDLVAKSQRQTLERYTNPSSIISRMREVEMNRAFREGRRQLRLVQSAR